MVKLNEIKKYITILGLSGTIYLDAQTVNKAYRQMAKIYHPDVADLNNKDGTMFVLIREAKNYLLENLDCVNSLLEQENQRIKNEQTRKENERRAKDNLTKKQKEELIKKQRREKDLKEMYNKINSLIDESIYDCSVKEGEMRLRMALDYLDLISFYHDCPSYSMEKNCTLKLDCEKIKFSLRAKRLEIEREKAKNDLVDYFIALNKNDYYKKDYDVIVKKANSFLSNLSTEVEVEKEYESLIECISVIPTIAKRKQMRFKMLAFIVAVIVVAVMCTIAFTLL